MAVYDKAKWHFEGQCPKELPIYQGYVHIGLYLGWAVERGFAGKLLNKDFTEEVSQFLNGRISGPRLLEITDGVLDDQMLSEEGNRFTSAYYGAEKDGYYSDYEATFPHMDSIYHVQNTPESFDKIKACLDGRLATWRANQK
ncbi:hypothetical protein OpiT1DRAFT_05403 [Opitutaceae bacterium TAV1]|nr:hypothetical protein OpiT1DRAFT_05403 [Opitutaceae bacterium TAV1]